MGVEMKREKYPTRKIYLRGPVQVMTLQAVLQGIPLDPDRPVVVTIGEEVKKRNLSQNALMWVGPLKDISEQVYMNNRTYSDEVWAEYFKRQFLPEVANDHTVAEYVKWQELPSGERILVGSTTQLTERGFAEYLEQVYAFGAQHGVEFHEARQ